jgi:hypothetical protein
VFLEEKGMVDKHFEIQSDHDQNIVRIVVAGFWRPDDFVDFVAAITAEERYFASRSQSFRAICDARQFNVQGGDIIQMFSGFFDRPGIPITQAALVISSTLLKLQAMRVATDSKYRFFDNVDEAEEWIAG